MAGTYEFDWWRKLVARATDNELEQACSGLGYETDHSATQNAVAMQIMHDEALAELGRRSRAATPAQRRPHDYEPGDEQHRMAGDPDCRVCGETRRICEGTA